MAAVQQLLYKTSDIDVCPHMLIRKIWIDLMPVLVLAKSDISAARSDVRKNVKDIGKLSESRYDKVC